MSASIARPDPTWRERAACRDAEPDLFFPEPDFGPAYDAQVEQAKAVCAGCAVRAECLSFAMSWLGYGVAGGLSQDERWQLVGATRRTAVRRSVTTLPGSTRAEISAAGRSLLAEGRSPESVARECGVSIRTALRWAAQIKGAAA
ncbi:WhiB family transcriptional regulator [Pseudonocardia sp.]|uniref:WhiB family transcriptional regulator n=1 Tax=Pseudonocardia sp. TaxID=60912 RepID=UPI003D0E86A0